VSAKVASHPTATTIRTARGRLWAAAYQASTIALATLIIVIWGIPLYWMALTSFKPERQIMVYPPEWVPTELTLDHYQRVFGMFPIGVWFKNSIIVAVVTTVVVVLVHSLAAYALARMSFRGRNLILFVILSAFVTPLEIGYIPLFLALSEVRLTDTYFSLIAPVASGPFGLFLFLQFFKGLPSELEDAARIDGCSSFRVYWNIVMPLSQAAVTAVAIFTFMRSWDNFMWPLIVVGSDKSFTLPVGLANLTTRSSTTSIYYGDAMAAATVATVPALLVFLLLQKHFVKGVTMSGLKG
jgi:multiple sugar transport system permease protein